LFEVQAKNHKPCKVVPNIAQTSNLLKTGVIVLVFTDGQSNDKTKTASEAKQLHTPATVYSFAIGSNYNKAELQAISSDGDYSELKDFKAIEDIKNEILSKKEVCGEYDCKNIFRRANPATLRTKGCSKVTGQGQ